MLNLSVNAPTIQVSPNIGSKRLSIIDALRGITLFGILIVHSYATFGQLDFTYELPGQFEGLNLLIDKHVGNLFSNTLYSIFSFLFGLSFAIQLQSSLSKNTPFVGRFLWRLTILMVFGYLHSLFFERDILQMYALIGTVLVLFSNSTNKCILASSVFCFLLAFLVVFSQDLLKTRIVLIGEALREIYLFRLIGLHRFDAYFINGRLFTIAGLFLLGLYGGKKKIFVDTSYNRWLFKKILLLSLVTIGLCFMMIQLAKAKNAQENVSITIFAVERLAQSFFYVALMVFAYKLNLFRIIADLIGQAGKMGLTTYIGQSVFLIYFYNLHPAQAIAQLQPATIVAITSAFFCLQISFAIWWFSKFRYGPLEWIWRSLTYLKWIPIKKMQTSEVLQNVEKQ